MFWDRTRPANQEVFAELGLGWSLGDQHLEYANPHEGQISLRPKSSYLSTLIIYHNPQLIKSTSHRISN